MKDFLPIVLERQGQPVTTSRAVAEQFGKRHDNVLRDIESLISDLDALKIEGVSESEERVSLLKIEESTADFAKNNFIKTSALDNRGKEQPMYLLTRDGFTLLAMGFTGARALQFKVAYIDAFNRMEQIIKGGMSSAALSNFEARLQALESTAGSGTGDVANTVVFSFLQALQEAIDSGEYYIKTRKEEAPKGKFLGFIERDCIALRKRAAYEIYASKVKEPLSHGALWSILKMSGTAFPDGYRCEHLKFKKCNFRAIYIKSDKLKKRK